MCHSVCQANTHRSCNAENLTACIIDSPDSIRNPTGILKGAFETSASVGPSVESEDRVC